jgi:hypothetical protein
MAEEPVVFKGKDEFQGKVSEILSGWPLYKILEYWTEELTCLLPPLVELYCSSPECEDVTLWETFIKRTPPEDYRGWKSKEYTCRHCKKAKVTYHYVWIEQDPEKKRAGRFFKWGQYPTLSEFVPRELIRRLDLEDLKLYRKSLRCRNQDIGLGAVSYLRRVVENKINQLLDEIATEAHKYRFEEEQLKQLADVKKDWRFSEKIKYASLILPPSLRPGEHNPMDQLHDLASEGLHYLPDEECLELYDRCKPVFEYLFREIDARKRSAEQYKEKLAELASKRTKRTGEGTTNTPPVATPPPSDRPQ